MRLDLIKSMARGRHNKKKSKFRKSGLNAQEKPQRNEFRPREKSIGQT